MKKYFTGLLLVLLSLVVVACGPATLEPTQSTTTTRTTTVTTADTQPTVAGQFLKSDLARNTSPGTSQSDLGALANGNSEFAFDLYTALMQQQTGNFFFSPYSLSLALAMAYAGARGDTAQEMAEVLHFNLSPDLLHQAFNYTALELAKRADESMTSKDGNGFKLNVVNDAWGQQGYPFLQHYLDSLATNYGAGMRVVNFANGEAVRQEINKYISDMTQGRIKDLIPPGALDGFTRLVLTNAIYFNAAWMNEFNEKSTRDGTFYLSDGSRVTVPMMRQTYFFGYLDGPGYQAVKIPYENNHLSMTIIMPDKGQFKAFQDSLDWQKVSGILSALKGQEVILTMPRFRFSSEFNLSEVLEAMGMKLALSPSADFSGIAQAEGLSISSVLHKSFISVDEKGTEAAAASAVMIAGAAPLQPPAMTLDHPFIFLIRDNPTGAVLFVGRVMNPTAS
jgi:serpin B